jgi:hypothetical protein
VNKKYNPASGHHNIRLTRKIRPVKGESVAEPMKCRTDNSFGGRVLSSLLKSGLTVFNVQSLGQRERITQDRKTVLPSETYNLSRTSFSPS